MWVTILGIIVSVITASITGVLAIFMKNVNDDTRAYRQQRKNMEIKKKEEDERNEALHKEGLLVIIRVMLKNKADTCFDKGHYTSEEREIYHEMFEVYKALGGNGVIADLGERLRKLPYEPEEK